MSARAAAGLLPPSLAVFLFLLPLLSPPIPPPPLYSHAAAAAHRAGSRGCSASADAATFPPRLLEPERAQNSSQADHSDRSPRNLRQARVKIKWTLRSPALSASDFFGRSAGGMALRRDRTSSATASRTRCTSGNRAAAAPCASSGTRGRASRWRSSWFLPWRSSPGRRSSGAPGPCPP